MLQDRHVVSDNHPCKPMLTILAPQNISQYEKWNPDQNGKTQKNLPVPFLVYLFEICLLFDDCSSSGQEKHAAKRTPLLVNEASQCTKDENMKTPIAALSIFFIHQTIQSIGNERDIQYVLYIGEKTNISYQPCIKSIAMQKVKPRISLCLVRSQVLPRPF